MEFPQVLTSWESQEQETLDAAGIELDEQKLEKIAAGIKSRKKLSNFSWLKSAKMILIIF